MTPASKRKFYAVIHASSVQHGQANVAAAMQAGADGVALINQRCSPEDMEKLALVTKQAFPRATVLVNQLGDNAATERIALRVGYGTEESTKKCGVWVDSYDPSHLGELDRLLRLHLPFFAGVGFKYQPESDLEVGWKLAHARRFALEGAAFVPMTSGHRTGAPPEMEKLRAFRHLLGKICPLAVASGVDAENIGGMLPFATHFLVGTSLETGGPEFNLSPPKVAEISAIVRSFNAANGFT